MRERACDERGFTMLTTMMVLATVVVFVGVAVAVALNGLDHSQRARNLERAQHAADAGAEIAGYRMSKTLLNSSSAGLLGTTTSALRTAGCIGVNLSFGNSSGLPTAANGVNGSVNAGTGVNLRLIPSGSNFCLTSEDGSLGDGTTFRYAVSTQIVVSPAALAGVFGGDSTQLIVRKVVSIGKSGSSRKRVLVTYWTDLTDTGQPFKRRRYVRCPAAGWSASDPFAGCPTDPGL